jgi:hypothetical protein
MILIKSYSNREVIWIFTVICAVILSPIMGIAGENKEKAPPKPMAG